MSGGGGGPVIPAKAGTSGPKSAGAGRAKALASAGAT